MEYARTATLQLKRPLQRGQQEIAQRDLVLTITIKLPWKTSLLSTVWYI